MKTEQIYNLYRHWCEKRKVSEISRLCGLDRKTVREYQFKLTQVGLDGGEPAKIREDCLPVICQLIRKKNSRRPKEAYEELRAFEEEVKELVSRPKASLKAKTIFELLQERNGISCSYSTFKRFVRSLDLPKNQTKAIYRIETHFGDETQIDYGKTGLHIEPKTGKRKTVYGFIGILSASRLPYVEFVYKQDEMSFSSSHVSMFEFYGGVTSRINLDNLKSGVIKPDLYDPILNKTYAELISHYGTFADPSRVATPTDKGKVERHVQVVREQFKKYMELYPNETLTELNKRIQSWCMNDYGQKKHGTTRVEPKKYFDEQEKPTLRSLPETPFEVCKWKQAKVHPDRFVQFELKRYGLPAKYIGAKLWIKKRKDQVYIFHEHTHVKTFLIPKSKSYAFDKNDFPEKVREMMEGSYPKYLISEAKKINELSVSFIEKILTPNAYVNARRAKGVLDVLKKNQSYSRFTQVLADAISIKAFNQSRLKDLFREDQEQLYFENTSIACSEKGNDMKRSVSYYIT